MLVHATCLNCERDFRLMDLQPAGPWAADRCPSCNALIGVRGGTAVQVHIALEALVEALEELGRSRLNIRLDPDSILMPIKDALVAIQGVSPSGDDVPAERRSAG